MPLPRAKTATKPLTGAPSVAPVATTPAPTPTPDPAFKTGGSPSDPFTATGITGSSRTGATEAGRDPGAMLSGKESAAISGEDTPYSGESLQDLRGVGGQGGVSRWEEGTARGENTQEREQEMAGRMALGQDGWQGYFNPYGLGRSAGEQEGDITQQGLGITPRVGKFVPPWLDDAPGIDRTGTKEELGPGEGFENEANQMWSDIMSQMEDASAGREGQFANIMSSAGRRASEMGPSGGGQQIAQLQGGVMAGREISEIQRQDALRKAEMGMTMLQNRLKQAEAAKDRDAEMELQNMIAQMELEIASIENPESGPADPSPQRTPDGRITVEVSGADNIAALNAAAAEQGVGLTPGGRIEFNGGWFEIDTNGRWVKIITGADQNDEDPPGPEDNKGGGRGF